MNVSNLIIKKEVTSIELDSASSMYEPAEISVLPTACSELFVLNKERVDLLGACMKRLVLRRQQLSPSQPLSKAAFFLTAILMALREGKEVGKVVGKVIGKVSFGLL